VSKPEVINIVNVEYVRKDAIKDDGIKIAVLDRGFVYIGYVKIEGDFLYLSHAKNIRYWGTTKGLGELVSGPTKDTKLDAVGNVTVPIRALISLIDVEQSKWNLF